MKVSAIVPVLNEELTIASVVLGLRGHGVDEVVVVDNGSTDGSVHEADLAGARVVSENRRGYGSACLAGLESVDGADVIVFADGDGCDDPEDLPSLLEPIEKGLADMVIGSRLAGRLDPGALPVHSRVGNRVASVLLRVIYGQRASDLGPFRAIRSDSLAAMQMEDTSFGWTVEMQAKAAMMRFRVVEVPVHYRKRTAGKSKITGNIRASMMAGWIIIKTLILTRIRAHRLVREFGKEDNRCTAGQL